MDFITSLCVSLAHAFASAASALNGAQYAINVSRSAPLLMSQNVYTELLFASLDQIHIGQHAATLKLS